MYKNIYTEYFANLMIDNIVKTNLMLWYLPMFYVVSVSEAGKDFYNLLHPLDCNH